MTGTVDTIGLRLRVESGAEGVSATATVKNRQTGHLGSQFGFAMLDEKLPKLGYELGERVGEEQSFFCLLLNLIF
jgi:hypothetical protein